MGFTQLLAEQRLVELRGQAPEPSTTILSDGRQIDSSPDSSRPPSPITTVQNQLEQALLDLHRLTKIPPTIPILNNQVALKTLRITDANSPKAKRLQSRFEHEIVVWSQLKHENVLTLLGIVTNMGPIYISMTPTNIHSYRYENPDVNPLKLLCQASKGLEYLHDNQIVHGHRESPPPNTASPSTNPTPPGVVTLSDFGLTQVLSEVFDKVTITNTAAVRWHAPELNDSEDTTLTKASDVFAFGMSVLELLTMKPPYSHRKRDVFVLQDLIQGVLPPRPEEPEAVPWMSDELWELLNRCWKWNPEERMLAKELSPSLQRMSELATN
ncbi:kinase-like domain-containing protein [Chiua virens]|nr:kinase-like domain-containing protein [Chiua virens]